MLIVYSPSILNFTGFYGHSGGYDSVLKVEKSQDCIDVRALNNLIESKMQILILSTWLKLKT